jgi:hypothetical protein
MHRAARKTHLTESLLVSNEVLADPYDLDAIKTVPSPHIETQKILLVSVKERPGKHQFFRTHPDPAYSTEWFTLTYESETSDREIYWVAPPLWGVLEEYIVRVRLYTCIDRQKNLFLWPCKLPDDDSNSTSRKWALSRLQAAEEAKHLWIRIAGNKIANAYERTVAQANLGDPVWPDRPLKDLIALAFGDEKTITSPDHPVIKKINGAL